MSSSNILKVGLRLQDERNYCIFLPPRVLLAGSSGYFLRRFASSLEDESINTVNLTGLCELIITYVVVYVRASSKGTSNVTPHNPSDWWNSLRQKGAHCAPARSVKMALPRPAPLRRPRQCTPGLLISGPADGAGKHLPTRRARGRSAAGDHDASRWMDQF